MSGEHHARLLALLEGEDSPGPGDLKALAEPAFAEAAGARLLELARLATPSAERLLVILEKLVRHVPAPWLGARLARERANLVYLRGRYGEALSGYGEALDRYRALGDDLEAAITESTSTQSLALLGRYQQAHAAAARARAAFLHSGAERRLAQLDVNEGNIFFRQDRFEEALACYQRAWPTLERDGSALDHVAALSNLAVTLTSLGEFQEAEGCYLKARARAADSGFAQLVAQADYNVAYLYFLRGEYARALAEYADAYDAAVASGDGYHAALCDLDRAEVALELNLGERGLAFARRAEPEFRALGLTYEGAKALAFAAVAATLRREHALADSLFAAARSDFAADGNRVWPGLIDLYRAASYCEQGRWAEARRLASQAATLFTAVALPRKADWATLLEARLDLAMDHPQAALARLHRLGERRGTELSPLDGFHLAFLEGEARLALGEPRAAVTAFEQAASRLEEIRGGLDREELKIAFQRDKAVVFERLFALSYECSAVDLSYLATQRAKSRVLLDGLSARLGVEAVGADGVSELVARLHHFRGDLAGLERQRERLELEALLPSPERQQGLARRARERQTALERALAEATASPGSSSLGRPATAAEVAGTLGEGELVLELYEADGELFAALLGRDGREIRALGPASHLVRPLRLLRFQLSKFRLGERYTSRLESVLEAAVRRHLAELGEALFEPLEGHLRGARRLVIAPHGFLHAIPFAALETRGGTLVERFELAHAPSGTLLARLRQRPALPAAEVSSLVVGVPAPGLPQIAAEVERVAATLPGALCLLGPEATVARVTAEAPRHRIIHLCGHGTFASRDPLASAIHLADGPLDVPALERLSLRAELVTLSGCGTGLAVVEPGDELLGLQRALLLAGARSMLVTLWDAHDDSAAALMAAFYTAWRGGRSRAAALREAQLGLCRERPHPYFWAPFVLVGEPG